MGDPVGDSPVAVGWHEGFGLVVGGSRLRPTGNAALCARVACRLSGSRSARPAHAAGRAVRQWSQAPGGRGALGPSSADADGRDIIQLPTSDACSRCATTSADADDDDGRFACASLAPRASILVDGGLVPVPHVLLAEVGNAVPAQFFVAISRNSEAL